MATPEPTSGPQAAQPLTPDVITGIVIRTLFEVEGIYLSASVARGFRAAIAAVLIGHEVLTETRLQEIVRAALGAAFDPMQPRRGQ